MCARPCKRPLLTLLLIEQRLAWGHSVELLYQAQWDSDESRFKVNFVDWRIRIWRKKIEEYNALPQIHKNNYPFNAAASESIHTRRGTATRY